MVEGAFLAGALTHRHDINRPRIACFTHNYRSSGDADFRGYLVASAIVRGSFTSYQQTNLPVLTTGIAIEDVDRIVFGADNHHVLTRSADPSPHPKKRLPSNFPLIR